MKLSTPQLIKNQKTVEIKPDLETKRFTKLKNFNQKTKSWSSSNDDNNKVGTKGKNGTASGSVNRLDKPVARMLSTTSNKAFDWSANQFDFIHLAPDAGRRTGSVNRQNVSHAALIDWDAWSWSESFWSLRVWENVSIAIIFLNVLLVAPLKLFRVVTFCSLTKTRIKISTPRWLNWIKWRKLLSNDNETQTALHTLMIEEINFCCWIRHERLLH